MTTINDLLDDLPKQAVSNVSRLIFYKMALILIPSGTGNPLGEAMEALNNKNKLADAHREASKWVKDALALVKTSPDNTLQTDEEIAGVIVEKMRNKRFGIPEEHGARR